MRTVQYLATNAIIAAHETTGNLVVPWCIQLLAVASNYSSQEKTWLNTISRLPLCSKIHSFPLNSTPDHQFWSHAQCVSEELETCCILPKWLCSNTMVQWCRGLRSFVSWILHWIIFLAQIKNDCHVTKVALFWRENVVWWIAYPILSAYYQLACEVIDYI